MIVDDLNVPGFSIAPHKTDPPLIVSANAALTLAVAVQCLQTIAGRSAIEGHYRMDYFPAWTLIGVRQTKKAGDCWPRVT